jgi:serine protease Do
MTAKQKQIITDQIHLIIMKAKTNLFTMLLAAILGGAIALGGFHFLNPNEPEANKSLEENQNIHLSKYYKEPKNDDYVVPDGLNFVKAAELVTPGVVHIKTYYDGNASNYGKDSMDDMLKDFFGDRYGERVEPKDGMQQMASGSGVIITEDGYIATNNHVIENATRVEVVLNDKRTYEAEVIGTDPTTDLGLLKIKEKNLPFVPYGSSDKVKVGQWVLAVGNPFDLTSTVTAGIVSAKGRSINILRGKSGMSIESFIQTDAAVNPGNSGGALVDLNGKLIGINTAIASNTGSFAGYSFAVPVDLAKKVMDDLSKYGEVRRALMGVRIQDIDSKFAEDKGLQNVKGVYIADVSPDGGAGEAGLQAGDIIISVEDVAVNSVAALQEQVGRKRPGDKVDIKYKRDGNTKTAKVELKGARDYDAVAISDSKSINIPKLGADFSTINADEKYKYEIDGGVKVSKLTDGKLKRAGITEGFIITKVDRELVISPEQLQRKLSSINDGVLIEGYNSKGDKEFIGVGF